MDSVPGQRNQQLPAFPAAQVVEAEPIAEEFDGPFAPDLQQVDARQFGVECRLEISVDGRRLDGRYAGPVAQRPDREGPVAARELSAREFGLRFGVIERTSA